jgi:hypothetical protein
MNEQQVRRPAQTLEQNVRLAVANLSGLPLDRIKSRPNRDKYAATGRYSGNDLWLSEVFQLMRTLNQRAVASSTLGRSSPNGQTFRDSLAKFATDVAEIMDGRRFTYVELGPEPVKTAFVIERLRDHGADVQRYIGVDINPASAQPMREALSAMIAPSHITFRLMDFADLGADDIHMAGEPSVITMFGFQEGNEHPATIADRLARIAAPGDLIASEMQVADTGCASDVAAFYQAPEIRRFSRLAFERMIGDIPSAYYVYTPVISVGFGEPTRTCVTAEAFSDPSDGGQCLALTNWCLKPSVHQMRVAREQDDRLDVRSERLTGDRRVLFQLAKVGRALAIPQAPKSRVMA